MPAYIVVNVDVKKPKKYEEYKHLVNPTIEAYGGRYLVRGGVTEVLEGNWMPKRLVIVEFPSAAQAKAWWESAEYAGAKALRQATSDTEMILATGL